MSLADWLDQVVAEQAAEQGVSLDDWSEEDRLDAIGGRLSQLSRRSPHPRDRFEGPDRQPIRNFPTPRRYSRASLGRETWNDADSHNEERRAQDRLEAALAKVEARASRSEERTAKALESVASWIERDASERAEESAKLAKVAEKLSALQEAPQRLPEPVGARSNSPQSAPSERSAACREAAPIESRAEEIDVRLNELAKRVEARTLPTAPPRAPLNRPRLDLRESLAQIARRQNALDSRSAVESSASDKPSKSAAASAAPANPGAALDALRAEILALNSRLDRMRADSRVESNERRLSSADAEAVRAELAAVSRSLANLAPHNGGVALAPVEAKLREVIEALRKHDPQAAVGALERELHSLSGKIDSLNSAVVKPQALGEILSQTQEIRRLLGAAAAQSVPVERLEKQIGHLADCVERLADSPAPRAEIERMLSLLADTRAQIERATSPAALNSIERRVEQLAGQIDEALSRPQPTPKLDARPIEELTRRIDAAMSRPQPAPQLDVKPIEDLTRRIDEALSRPQPEPKFDSKPIEDLARRIDSVRVALERQGDSSPQTAKLEAALADISAKLDRISAAGPNSQELNSTLQTLTARLEDAFRKPSASPALDARPVEELARRIEGVRATMERQADLRPDIAKLESALGELSAKIDRQVPASEESRALTDVVRTLADRIDQSANPVVDAKQLEQLISHLGARPVVVDTTPIERLIGRLEGKLDAVEARPLEFDATPIQAMLREIGDKIAVQASSAFDAASIESLMGRLEAKIDALEARPLEFDAAPLQAMLREVGEKISAQASSGVDAAPIESLMRRLEAKLDAAEARPFEFDAAPLQAMLREIGEKISAQASSGIDAASVESLIGRLEAKLDAVEARPLEFDATPIQRMLQELGDKLATNVTSGGASTSLEDQLSRLDAKLDALEARPVEIDTTRIQRMLDDLSDRVAASASGGAASASFEDLLHRVDAKLDAVQSRPVEIDTTPIQRMLAELNEKVSTSAPPTVDASSFEDLLHRLDAKLDAVDTRPIELAILDVRDRLESLETPTFDAKPIEQTAELIAQRIEARGGLNMDAEALINQITEIHERLDSLNAASASNAALERAVGQLASELDSTRELIKSASLPSPISSSLVNEIAGLKSEQTNSERRMAARLASVHDIVERLAERLQEIEEGGSQGDPAPETPAKPSLAAGAANLDLREIPDRAGASAKVGALASSAAGFGVTIADGAEASDFFLEPGAAAPGSKRGAEDNVPQGAKASDIQAHIAAARRAAVVEMAAQRERRAGSPPETGSRFAQGMAALKQAQTLVAGKRVPFLIGGAVLVLAAAAAVFELRGGRTPGVQKSELPAAVESPASPAKVGANDESVKQSARVDYSPTGAIGPSGAPTSSSTQPPVAGNTSGQAARPTPADLMAGLPDTLPQPLRDAAAAGDPGAQTEVGLRWLEGRTLARDPKIAARWLELAAVQGAPVAEYRLAALYEKGIGVGRDPQLARSWYLKAANAGNARAMHNLAVLDAEDAGSGKPDYAEAASWFRRAGQFGVRDSQYNLGVLYGRGLGVPQDFGQSWLWFSLAAQQGDADAGKKRDEVGAKLDANGLAAASKALAEFKLQTPSPEANDAPAPAGGWDGKSGAPQAARPSPSPTPGAHG